MSFAYLSYAITELYLIVFASTILFRLNMNLGSEDEVRELKHIIYAYFVLLVTDIFWALVEDHLIEPSRLANAAVNGISLAAVAAGCFFWYKFVEYRLHSPAHGEKELPHHDAWSHRCCDRAGSALNPDRLGLLHR